MFKEDTVKTVNLVIAVPWVIEHIYIVVLGSPLELHCIFPGNGFPRFAAKCSLFSFPENVAFGVKKFLKVEH